ncbi:MAG: 50S ribosomal protein L32 [Nocardioides sp.]
MAVPKRRTSRSNTRHRRAQWKATAPELVPIVVAGRVHRVPRRLVRAVERGLIDPATGTPRKDSL